MTRARTWLRRIGSWSAVEQFLTLCLLASFACLALGHDQLADVRLAPRSASAVRAGHWTMHPDHVAASLARGDLAVLDLRSHAHFLRGRIPGSWWIDTAAPEASLARVAHWLPVDAPVVLVESAEAPAPLARRDVWRHLGLHDVRTLAGGFDGWRRHGHAVVAGSDTVPPEHGDIR